VGLSLGGWIAAELAVHYEHRVRKLVLIGAIGLNLQTFQSGYFRGEARALFFTNPDSELANSFVSGGPSPEMLNLMLTARQASG
jgi:pimeloyl-ACP methyl ester carboxylesterase